MSYTTQHNCAELTDSMAQAELRESSPAGARGGSGCRAGSLTSAPSSPPFSRNGSQTCGGQGFNPTTDFTKGPRADAGLTLTSQRF